jgi:DNA-binding MarR family transcriptional regulator
MPATPDTVAVILRELHAVDRAGRALLGEAPLPGLTITGVTLLGVLARGGERRCGDLAGELGIDASAVSRKLAELERLGLVRRRPDPADGRAALLSATARGTAVLATLRTRFFAAVAASLAHWDDADLEHLAAALERLHADLAAGRSDRTTHLTGQEAYA